MAFWWMLALAWAGEGTVLPGSSTEVVFESDTRTVVEGALADLSGGHFLDAAEQLQVLADASRGPQLRYLEAMAWYEAGELRRAARAAEQGRAADPSLAPLNSLWGLILADLGRGDEAGAPLQAALDAARDQGDARLETGVRLNQGLVALDQGALKAATASFTLALQLASAEGYEDLAQRARENLAVVDQLGGGRAETGELGQVAEYLRRGEVEAAQKVLTKPRGSDRRARVQRALAEAEIERARGQLEAAAQRLHEALTLAREGGLLRESAASLAALGVLYRLGGRYPIARDELQEAVGLVAGTSFTVAEVTYRVEAGMVAVRLDSLEEARAQLAAARRAQGDEGPALGAVRIDELAGAVAAASGDVAGASAATQRAIQAREKMGHHADVARLCASLVQLYAGRDANLEKRWRQRALDAFQQAGDALGPAHVDISAGLGQVEAKRTDAAVEAFVRAAQQAEGVSGERAEQVARIARDNAAQALLVAGIDGERAKKLGLDEAVAAHQRFVGAEKDYEAALTAFNQADFSTARVRFHAAFEAFAALEEDGYALKARRGRAWASWNQANGTPAAQGYPVFYELVQEALVVEDPELHARALVSAALAGQELGYGDPRKTLTEAAKAAEGAGLDGLAGQCWAALSKVEGDLAKRALAARRAMVMRGADDPEAVYAVYSVAVDAYNADELGLAQELAAEALPQAGSLTEALQGVLDAVEAAR